MCRSTVPWLATFADVTFWHYDASDYPVSTSQSVDDQILELLAAPIDAAQRCLDIARNYQENGNNFFERSAIPRPVWVFLDQVFSDQCMGVLHRMTLFSQVHATDPLFERIRELSGSEPVYPCCCCCAGSHFASPKVLTLHAIFVFGSVSTGRRDQL